MVQYFSSQDTNREGGVRFSEVSLFRGILYMQVVLEAEESVIVIVRCPHFRGCKSGTWGGKRCPVYREVSMQVCVVRL